jgi:hypothetical protein
MMKLLLTSAGINNTSIHDTLVDLLSKPVAVEVGFEPTDELPHHTLSRRAPSATRRLHRSRAYRSLAFGGQRTSCG